MKHVSNEKDFRKMKIKIRKRELINMGYVMRKDGLENVFLKGCT